MITSKTRQAPVILGSSGQSEFDLRQRLPEHQTELNEAAELAIADDFEQGDDPYNSTGQHVILKLREDAGR